MSDQSFHSKTKKFPTAGYRVHFNRLKSMRAGVTAMRTHKYKCGISSQEAKQELQKKFQEVSKVVDSAEKGSLLWFLIQLYGLGFLFVSKEQGKGALLQELYPDRESLEVQALLEQLPEDIVNTIENGQALLTFLTTSPRKVEEKIKDNILPANLIAGLGAAWGIEKLTGENLSDYPMIKIYHDKLVEKAIELKRLNQEDIQAVFGVKVEKVKTGGITFVVQEIPLEELQVNGEQGIDIYDAYFRYLLPAAKRTGRDPQSLAGVSDNQNALSNLWNKTLRAFQESEENCKQLIVQANTLYFEQYPVVLEYLGKTVHRLAKEIPASDEGDFVMGNWADYRALIGGRLQGWLSNFENRLQNFQEALGDDGGHAKILATIQEHCDEEHIFPERTKEDLRMLRILRPELLDALNKETNTTIENVTQSRDFASLLREYSTYVRSLREFLIRWNNEGIPEKIDEHMIVFGAKHGEYFLNGKELCEKHKKVKKDEEDNREVKEGRQYKWKSSMIPKELDQYPRFIGAAAKNPRVEIEDAKGYLIDISWAGLLFLNKICQKYEVISEYNTTTWKETSGRKKSPFGEFHKHLEVIKKLAQIHESKILIKFLEEFIDWENTSLGQREHWEKGNLKEVRFYLSGYEYRQRESISVKDITIQNYIVRFENYFGLTFEQLQSKDGVEHFLMLNHGRITRQAQLQGEILKIYFSLKLKGLPKVIDIPELEEGVLKILGQTSLGSLLMQKGQIRNNMEISSIQRFFQASIGADIRGKLSLLTRQIFVERNVIQVTNGEQSLLHYVPREWGDFAHLHSMYSRKRKRIQEKAKKTFSKEALEILDSIGISAEQTNYNIVAHIWQIFESQKEIVQKALLRVLGEIPHSWNIVLKTKIPFAYIEPTKSGFFFEKSQEKQHYNLSVSKKNVYLYSFPVETSVVQKQFLERFLWGDRDNQLVELFAGPSIILENEVHVSWLSSGQVEFKDKKFTFYCAIPFQIQTKGEKVKKGETPRRDILVRGENILGIDLGEYGFGWAVFSPIEKRFVAAGFQAISLLPKMRMEAANWRDTQSRGIFSRPTTYLAELREQAAGQIRNQIHRLALEYHAKPIYEDSVDGFESGGQRIEKLYKTLKTADVITGGGNKADETVRKHFWGSAFVQIGGVIGASKTSQTCRHCGRCATAEIEGQEEAKLEVRYGLILGSILCSKESGIYDKKELAAAVKFAQRGAGTDGGQSAFSCQFQDCKNESHADEQAAKNIALKYYFKNTNDENIKKEREVMEKDEKYKDRVSISLPFFLKKSQELEWQERNS